jgi:hypothetical protein
VHQEKVVRAQGRCSHGSLKGRDNPGYGCFLVDERPYQGWIARSLFGGVGKHRAQAVSIAGRVSQSRDTGIFLRAYTDEYSANSTGHYFTVVDTSYPNPH